MDLHQGSFIIGFIFGFAIAGVLGNILQRIRKARQGMGAPDNPMSVKTSGTPRSVMAAAAAAFRTFLFWSFVLFAFVGLVAVMLYALLFYA